MNIISHDTAEQTVIIDADSLPLNAWREFDEAGKLDEEITVYYEFYGALNRQDITDEMYIAGTVGVQLTENDKITLAQMLTDEFTQ